MKIKFNHAQQLFFKLMYVLNEQERYLLTETICKTPLKEMAKNCPRKAFKNGTYSRGLNGKDVGKTGVDKTRLRESLIRLHRKINNYAFGEVSVIKIGEPSGEFLKKCNLNKLESELDYYEKKRREIKNKIYEIKRELGPIV